jgi:hypothetical protein
VVELADDEPARPEPAALPDSLVQFARSSRFAAVTERLGASAPGARNASCTPWRHRRAGPRPPPELDWHRILDTVVLIALR